MSKQAQRCTWCSKDVDCNDIVYVDAAKVRHRFHSKCWDEHRAFMGAKPVRT